MKIILSAYRLYLNTAFLIAPDWGAKKAFQVFATPRRQKVADKEKAILAQAHQSVYRFENKALSFYRWKNPHQETATKKALLVHGWDGHAGNFGAIVQLLLNKGYEVLAFDGPAHRASEGKQTNMLQFARLIDQILRQESQIEVLIGHSFGSGASVLSLHDYPKKQIKKLILLSTPDKIEDVILNFSQYMHLSRPNTERIFNFVEQKFNRKVQAIRVSEQSKKLTVPEILLIHDRYDRVLPFAFAESVATANPKIELFAPEKVGHYKMLWKAVVLEKIASFI
ncbi:alpha/beta hydrolase [Hugenholtzia roseola]|uniref:alpha/beta hydrolase n=1 Tax=Hugenholtzia roseola TaxID=1002 RepID=UPI00041A6627|nr:alpha/beta hydrolase [Hugenholtzia roseola]